MLNVEHGEPIEEKVYHSVEIEDVYPTIDEVRKAIKRLKNNKSPGSDEISCELIKKGGPSLEYEIYKLIRKCWKEENIPSQWREVIIVPIHKKATITAA